MEISQFRKRLQQYTYEAEAANSEATKAFLFLEFIRDVFSDIQADNPHNLYPELEKQIKSKKTVLIKGRIDAFLGNLIIEFESSLKESKREEALEQLKRYTAIIWNNKGIMDFLCIATDGTSFLVYRPRSERTENFTADMIVLEVVDRFDIKSEDSSTLYKRLDRYMLYRSLVAPESEDIVEYFGLNSVIFSDCENMLTKAWNMIKFDASVVYEQWSKYLSITYGSNVDSDDLFRRHTYLATLAKLMVYCFYQENTLPISGEIVKQILNGGVFKEWGIENFLIEDFFSWIARDKVDEYGKKIANRILDGLSRYDLTRLNEDIFKELYQELIDPEERHDLGEYYTPDWLAELIVRNVLPEPELRVLDPACGSGTFLATVIRVKSSLINNPKQSEKLSLIIDTVCGIDVHPIAVLISKANYLMALGKLIINRKGPVTIPIYMADSITFPTPTQSIATYNVEEKVEVYHYKVGRQTELIIPKSIVEAKTAESIIDFIKEFTLQKVANSEISMSGFKTHLQKKFGIPDHQVDILLSTTETLVQLVNANKDTIYPFILKNIFKPSTIGKFDIVIGNPPWLSYKYINSMDRQSELKQLIVKKYSLLEKQDSSNITNLELATLFLLRCLDLYSVEGGTIAFVMPRSIFTADQHHNLRTGVTTEVKYGISEIWDLEVENLFNMPSCVIIAKKGGTTVYPIPSLNVKALPEKRNTRLISLQQSPSGLLTAKIMIGLIGSKTRSAWSSENIEICNGDIIKKEHSDYLEKFNRGADIYPRQFWFIDVKTHGKFGIDANMPYVETSERASDLAKEEYKGVHIRGNIESKYLYATLLGSDIMPFCHLPFRRVVLPVEVRKSSYSVVTSQLLGMKGDIGISEWMRKVETVWNKRRGEKASMSTIYDWLDYRRKLSSHNLKIHYFVLYLTSGTFLAASLVDITRKIKYQIEQENLHANGFFVDTTAYYFQTDNKNEAYYLTAVLNSKVLDTLIKPIQARGLWGPRHIHKKPLEFPISQFDPQNKIHSQLVRLGKDCSTKASSAVPKLLTEMNINPSTISARSVGRLRGNIRELLSSELSEIDEQVCKLFTN
jgi:hypothetical protein